MSTDATAREVPADELAEAERTVRVAARHEVPMPPPAMLRSVLAEYDRRGTAEKAAVAVASQFKAWWQERGAELDRLTDENARLRARAEAAKAVADQAELTCAVIERVLDADASEGTPIWEWTDEEAEAGVRKVLHAADELCTALDALARAHEDGGRGGLMSDHEMHLVPAGDGTYVVVLEDGCLECAERAVQAAVLAVSPPPVDWPARFRAAAEVADGLHAGNLLFATGDELACVPTETVEAIGRALLGEGAAK